MNQPRFSIAIDGPAGSGKSTVAKRLALRFGLQYLDTGAMYRGVALLAIRANAAWDDSDALGNIAENARFAFRVEPFADDLVNHISLNGEDVTHLIRTPEISRAASPVSAVSSVRRALVSQQQKMGATGGIVMEGRDIGTVVLPDAEVKIFLTASPRIRARRRCDELTAKGIDEPFEKVLAEITERDERDSSRADSPLVPASDSVHVDTDPLDIQGVVDAIANIVQQRGLK